MTKTKKTAGLKHFVWFDDPSATSTRSQRAACGLWVAPRDVVKQDDEVTCPDCRRRVADHDALNIDDDGKDASA
jgi:hypothetical protein